MEPLTLVGSLGFAFARGLAGRAGSRLLPANDVGLRLSSIEAKLATMTADAHREPLRQGISLLRHAITTGDSRDRARRRSAAEDHLLVAADDTRLTPDDRAAAAILLATSFADREDQDRATQWLWQAQGFLAFFVNDRLHFADAIMSDAAPRWVVEDLDKQRKAAGVVARLRTFHPRTSHLRQALVDQARSVLPVWENVRGVLDATESGLYFPTPTIASRYRGSFVAAEDEPLKLVIQYGIERGNPSVGGAIVIRVDEYQTTDAHVKTSGWIQQVANVPMYRNPWESKFWFADLEFSEGAFPKATRFSPTRHDEEASELQLGASFEQEAIVDEDSRMLARLRATGISQSAAGERHGERGHHYLLNVPDGTFVLSAVRH